MVKEDCPKIISAGGSSRVSTESLVGAKGIVGRPAGLEFGFLYLP